MKTYITGCRSKIAKKIGSYLEQFNFSSEVCFITNNKREKKTGWMFDFTSYSKRKKLKNFNYGFLISDINTKNVSIPGCSSLGILYALMPILKYVDDIQASVDFPLSSLKRNSPSLNKLKQIDKIELKRRHFHQNEIETYINKKINYKTYISNREELLKIKINFRSNKSVEYLQSLLVEEYKSLEHIKINTKTKTKKDLSINIKKTGKNNITVSVSLDNVDFPVWHCFYLIDQLNLASKI